MRRVYKRSDFAKLERGKFYEEVTKGTTVVLLSPENAKAFPSSRAVNEALAVLRAAGTQTSRITARSARPRAKAARAG
jgi:hypothetical protein